MDTVDLKALLHTIHVLKNLNVLFRMYINILKIMNEIFQNMCFKKILSHSHKMLSHS